MFPSPQFPKFLISIVMAWVGAKGERPSHRRTVSGFLEGAVGVQFF